MSEKISHLYKTSVKVILDLWIVKDESSKTWSMYQYSENPINRELQTIYSTVKFIALTLLHWKTIRLQQC